jgi:protein-S-isoprenylcysteine O-methyltransferase Ste14
LDSFRAWYGFTMLRTFRPAVPASFAWNHGKTLIQTTCFSIVFPTLIVSKQALLPWDLTFAAPPLLGALLLALVSPVGLWAGYTMARYQEGILQGVAVGLSLGSGVVVLYALAGAPVWHMVARPPEEADMRQRFGEEVEHYRRNVHLWVPRTKSYRPGDGASV